MLNSCPVTQGDLLSSKDAAEALGVSQATVARWAREGYIAVRRSPSRHGKGRIRVPREEIERLQRIDPERVA